jgi:hypothetical protein
MIATWLSSRPSEPELPPRSQDQVKLGAALTLVLAVELGEEADAKLKETAANTEEFRINAHASGQP